MSPPRQRIRHAARALALAVAFTLAGRAAHAQPQPQPQPQPTPEQPPGVTDVPSDKVPGEDKSLYSCDKAKNRKTWANLKPETELKDLLEWAQGFTCKNFIYSPQLAQRASKVTIVAPLSMTPQEAWRVFLVALQTMNLTVVPKGNVLEIVESNNAKEQPLPVYRHGQPPQADQIVRVILRPRHIGVQELADTLMQLKSQFGTVVPLLNAGLLVVTDYGNIIDKMVEIVAEVDRPVVGERLYLIRVKYADATDLAAKLTEIFATQGPQGGGSAPVPRPQPQPRGARQRPQPAAAEPAAPAPAMVAERPGKDEIESAVPSKIIADERTNSLIVLASESAYYRVRALVDVLDTPVEGAGAGEVHVYRLENADAEEMSTTLNSVVTGLGSQQQGQGAGARGGNARGRAPQAAVQAAPVGEGGGAAFEGQVRIAFDKPTNQLVIVASGKDFLALKDVIKSLDIPRRQVFIEAVILEVSVDNTRRFGSSFHIGTDVDVGSDRGNAILLGGVQHADLSSLNVSTLASQSGLLGALLGPILNEAEQIIGVSIPSFGVLFQALANSNDVNVLSAPHILTTDNEPAEISVGQNIPYQGGFSSFGFGGAAGGAGGAAGGAAGGGFGLPGVSIQRQDIVLKLKIEPHINASDMVRLVIEQEISDIASENFGNNLGPSWTKRDLKTTIVVHDQQPVVIGGLMSDKTLTSQSKVPLLGDIPVLGSLLFKYSRKTKQKTNLLIYLTPYVIKDQMDIERIVERKLRERREFIETFTTFDAMSYRPDTDYRRKRGGIEEINRSVIEVNEERALLEELSHNKETVPEGAIEYHGPETERAPDVDQPGGEGEGDGQGEGAGTPTEPPTNGGGGGSGSGAPPPPGGPEGD